MHGVAELQRAGVIERVKVGTAPAQLSSFGRRSDELLDLTVQTLALLLLLLLVGHGHCLSGRSGRWALLRQLPGSRTAAGCFLWTLAGLQPTGPSRWGCWRSGRRPTTTPCPIWILRCPPTCQCAQFGTRLSSLSDRAGQQQGVGRQRQQLQFIRAVGDLIRSWSTARQFRTATLGATGRRRFGQIIQVFVAAVGKVLNFEQFPGGLSHHAAFVATVALARPRRAIPVIATAPRVAGPSQSFPRFFTWQGSTRGAACTKGISVIKCEYKKAHAIWLAAPLLWPVFRIQLHWIRPKIWT